MDLTKIDELDARQKALDEERAQARKAVLNLQVVKRSLKAQKRSRHFS